MLLVEAGKKEGWDPVKEEFVKTPGYKTYSLEHSLWSVAQWETIYRKPFLTSRTFEVEEFQAYLNLMSKDGPINLFDLDEGTIKEINEYINDTPTATTIRDLNPGSGSSTFTTSETLYATMTIARIPWEAQYWHLNRLVTLIRVINEFSGEKKKMSQKDVLAQNRELNRQRRAELKTKG